LEVVAALLLSFLSRGGARGDINGAGCNSEDHGGNSEEGLGEMHFGSVFWSEGYRV